MLWLSRTCSEIATGALVGAGLTESPCPVTANMLNNLISHGENQGVKAEAAGTGSAAERVPLESYSRAERAPAAVKLTQAQVLKGPTGTASGWLARKRFPRRRAGLGALRRDAATQGCDKTLCVSLCRRSSGAGGRRRGLCRGGCSTRVGLGRRGTAPGVPSPSPSLGPSSPGLGAAAQSRLCSPAATVI